VKDAKGFLVGLVVGVLVALGFAYLFIGIPANNAQVYIEELERELREVRDIAADVSTGLGVVRSGIETVRGRVSRTATGIDADIELVRASLELVRELELFFIAHGNSVEDLEDWSRGARRIGSGTGDSGGP
jgi:hypothetical protein